MCIQQYLFRLTEVEHLIWHDHAQVSVKYIHVQCISIWPYRSQLLHATQNITHVYRFINFKIIFALFCMCWLILENKFIFNRKMLQTNGSQQFARNTFKTNTYQWNYSKRLKRLSNVFPLYFKRTQLSENQEFQEWVVHARNREKIFNIRMKATLTWVRNCMKCHIGRSDV